MTALIECLTRIEAQPLAHALGWTLLHFCWQGVVVAAMLWFVLRLLHGQPAQARYAAACSALLLLVALPLVTFVQLARQDLAANRMPAIPIYIAGSTLLVNASAASSEPLLARIEDLANSFVPWLPVLWLAGVAFFLVRLNFGLLAARRMKSTRAEPAGAELQRAFERMRVRLGVGRAVRLMHSALVEVPTVIGWLRPVVLVPASCLTGLSPLQIEAVLAHELAHVRRHDYLVSVFQSVVEALLFYHPAVWWVSHQVRRERECCCDELAVVVGGDVVAYARALSYLEERRGSVPEFVLGANGGVLTMRIKRLLGRGENAAASQVAALVVLAVIVAGLGSYWATVAHAQKQRAHAAILPDEPIESTESNQLLALDGIQTLPLMHPAQQAASGADTSASLPHGIYKTWLEQDVRWIITDAEAQAYQRLANDEERDRFIEQFWQRRNPPGSAPDSAREEHYARIAYTNEHFASNDHVGWSTDRGHIYIAYGKPDSIDAHPSGGLALPPNGRAKEMPPFEVWHYNDIPGIGDHVDLTFVDTCKCGDYNLTIDQPGQIGAGAESDKARAALAAKILAPPVVNAMQQGASAQPADTAERPNPLKRRLSDKERLQQDRRWS
jgi:GWxTD domain-containing protein